jgi:hypothetical protein
VIAAPDFAVNQVHQPARCRDFFLKKKCLDGRNIHCGILKGSQHLVDWQEGKQSLLDGEAQPESRNLVFSSVYTMK